MQNAGATRSEIDVASKLRPEDGHKIKNFILQEGSWSSEDRIKGSLLPQIATRGAAARSSDDGGYPTPVHKAAIHRQKYEQRGKEWWVSQVKGPVVYI